MFFQVEDLPQCDIPWASGAKCVISTRAASTGQKDESPGFLLGKMFDISSANC
jgi:hypothetical protein